MSKKTLLILICTVLIVIVCGPFIRLCINYLDFQFHGSYIIDYDGSFPNVDDYTVLLDNPTTTAKLKFSDIIYYEDVPLISLMVIGIKGNGNVQIVLENDQNTVLVGYSTIGQEEYYNLFSEYIYFKLPEPLKEEINYKLRITYGSEEDVINLQKQ